jgi:hypothetical protein
MNSPPGNQPDRARLIAAALALDSLIKTTTRSRDLLDAAAGLQILATGGTLDLDEAGRLRARQFAETVRQLIADRDTPACNPSGSNAQSLMTWHLAAHPIRHNNSEAMARRREFKEAMRRRIRDIAASRDFSYEEIKPALTLKHHEIARFSEQHGVNIEWLLEGKGRIFNRGG